MTEESSRKITERYRAYCDACESGHLSSLGLFWDLPSFFVVSSKSGDVKKTIVSTEEELCKLYSNFFGPSTGVTKTVIIYSEIDYFGDHLATISTKLEHYAGDELHDTQLATYTCILKGGEWYFTTHVSLDVIV